jgi:hypothetical protein
MIGNPKSEIRRSKEDRNPKADDGSGRQIPTARLFFRLRVSAFGFPSELGPRISDFPPSGGA